MRVRCDHCNAAMINGVFCHEIGCPNTNKRYDPDENRWIPQYICPECGCRVDEGELCCNIFEDDNYDNYDEEELEE